jgi:hypothetical protein
MRAQPIGVDASPTTAGPDRADDPGAGPPGARGSLLLYTTGTQIKPLIDRLRAENTLM